MRGPAASPELNAAAQNAVRHGLLSLRKSRLKNFCRAQLLGVSGTKAKLVDNILKHYNRCQITVSLSDDGRAEFNAEAWYEPDGGNR